MPDQGLITPEAVRLHFETAGVATRALARAIDLAVAGFAGSTLVGFLAPFLGTTEMGVLLLASLFFLLVVLVYPALFEGFTRGRTLGKSVLGLRVVTREGAPIGMRQAWIRSFLQIVDFLLPPLGTVAIISALAGRQDQRLGDRLASTIVIRAPRGIRSQAVAFPPLPGYEGYVAGLDVTSVRADQYEILRAFLTRVLDFSPEPRVRLALGLARPLALQMRHTPPASLHPEHFLACVAAAYQAGHGGPATTMRWVATTTPFGPPPPPTPPGPPLHPLPPPFGV